MNHRKSKNQSISQFTSCPHPQNLNQIQIQHRITYQCFCGSKISYKRNLDYHLNKIHFDTNFQSIRLIRPDKDLIFYKHQSKNLYIARLIQSQNKLIEISNSPQYKKDMILNQSIFLEAFKKNEKQLKSQQQKLKVTQNSSIQRQFKQNQQFQICKPLKKYKVENMKKLTYLCFCKASFSRIDGIIKHIRIQHKIQINAKNQSYYLLYYKNIKQNLYYGKLHTLKTLRQISELKQSLIQQYTQCIDKLIHRPQLQFKQLKNRSIPSNYLQITYLQVKQLNLKTKINQKKGLIKYQCVCGLINSGQSKLLYYFKVDCQVMTKNKQCIYLRYYKHKYQEKLFIQAYSVEMVDYYKLPIEKIQKVVLNKINQTKERIHTSCIYPDISQDFIETHQEFQFQYKKCSFQCFCGSRFQNFQRIKSHLKRYYRYNKITEHQVYFKYFKHKNEDIFIVRSYFFSMLSQDQQIYSNKSKNVLRFRKIIRNAINSPIKSTNRLSHNYINKDYIINKDKILQYNVQQQINKNQIKQQQFQQVEQLKQQQLQTYDIISNQLAVQEDNKQLKIDQSQSANLQLTYNELISQSEFQKTYQICKPPYSKQKLCKNRKLNYVCFCETSFKFASSLFDHLRKIHKINKQAKNVSYHIIYYIRNQYNLYVGKLYELTQIKSNYKLNQFLIKQYNQCIDHILFKSELNSKRLQNRLIPQNYLQITYNQTKYLNLIESRNQKKENVEKMTLMNKRRILQRLRHTQIRYYDISQNFIETSELTYLSLKSKSYMNCSFECLCGSVYKNHIIMKKHLKVSYLLENFQQQQIYFKYFKHKSQNKFIIRSYFPSMITQAQRIFLNNNTKVLNLHQSWNNKRYKTHIQIDEKIITKYFQKENFTFTNKISQKKSSLYSQCICGKLFNHLFSMKSHLRQSCMQIDRSKRVFIRYMKSHVDEKYLIRAYYQDEIAQDDLSYKEQIILRLRKIEQKTISHKDTISDKETISYENTKQTIQQINKQKPIQQQLIQQEYKQSQQQYQLININEALVQTDKQFVKQQYYLNYQYYVKQQYYVKLQQNEGQQYQSEEQRYQQLII